MELEEIRVRRKASQRGKGRVENAEKANCDEQGVQCNENRREESADNAKKSEIMKFNKGRRRERQNGGISGCRENCISAEGGERWFCGKRRGSKIWSAAVSVK